MEALESSPEDVAQKVATKRKRRSTAEGKNADYSRPAKQRRGPLSPFDSVDGWNCSDTTSSTSPAMSDCFSANVECSLSSPASVANTLSPIGSEDVENAGEVSVESASGSGWQTPHSRKRAKAVARNGGVGEESPAPGGSVYVLSSEVRKCPLPEFSWASSTALWRAMINKDELDWFERESNMLQKHPGLMPRMRAILLDWLIEVCDVHKLKRETYYLAMDFIDRYLSRSTAVHKGRLQLIGVTCLFVAAKIEEIYPPKIGEFAYVTDGACPESDILEQELAILESLDWNMSTVTVMGWLTIYMQIHVKDPANLWKKTTMSPVRPCTAPSTMPHVNLEAVASLLTPDKCSPIKEDEVLMEKIDDAFVYPQFSGMEYTHTCQLLDLCSLDMGILKFPYSVVAAAAISHVYNKKVATRVSGLEWCNIEPCAKWMEPFFRVICDDHTPIFHLEQNEPLPVSFGAGHFCPNANTDESYKIQTHNISLEMLDNVIRLQEQELLTFQEQQIVLGDRLVTNIEEASPAPVQGSPCPVGLLTPPASNRKSPDIQPESDSKDTSAGTT